MCQFNIFISKRTKIMYENNKIYVESKVEGRRQGGRGMEDDGDGHRKVQDCCYPIRKGEILINCFPLS